MYAVKYETLGADNLNNLDREVNVAIKDGWQPLGGVAVAVVDDAIETRYTYLQAMVLLDFTP